MDLIAVETHFRLIAQMKLVIVKVFSTLSTLLIEERHRFETKRFDEANQNEIYSGRNESDLAEEVVVASNMKCVVSD